MALAYNITEEEDGSVLIVNGVFNGDGATYSYSRTKKKSIHIETVHNYAKT